MSIEDDIESGVTLNKEEAIKKVSSVLAEKNEQAKKSLALIAHLESMIKQEKENYKTLTEHEMPALLDELGISGITLSTGENICIDTSLHCGIPKDTEELAFEWLRNNNHSDLIKNEVKVKFGKNEDNLVGEVKGKLEELGLKFEEKVTVHNMTLKAFAREQMKSGKNLPEDLFDVYVRRIVEVKL